MLNQQSTVVRSVLGVSLMLACMLAVIAQDPSPTPTDEERRLEEEIRILKLKKDKATLKNEIREAVLSPSATPLEGKVELTDVTLEPELMSYRAMSTACDCIATRIKNRIGGIKPIIVIYDSVAAAELRYYRFSYPIVAARLKGISDRFDKAIIAQVAGSGTTKAAGLPLSPKIVTDVLRSFADVLALFRTDTKIEGKAVSINQKALTAEIQFALTRKFGTDVTLYDPGSFSLDGGAVVNTNGDFVSTVLRSLVDGYKKRDQVLLLIDAEILNIEKIKENITGFEERIQKSTKELADLEARLKKEKNKKKHPAINADIAKKKADIAAAEVSLVAEKKKLERAESDNSSRAKIVKDFDALVAELITINEKTGTNDLLTFLKAESLNLVLGNENYYWLDLSSVGAGGNNRTRKNLFRYIAGSKIDHSGGVIVQWRLLNREWKFFEGGKTQVYEGYLGSKKIRNGKVQFANDDLINKCGYPVPPEPDEEKNIARIQPPVTHK